MERVYSAVFNTKELKRFNKSRSSEELSTRVSKRKQALVHLKLALKAGIRAFIFAYGAKAFTAVLLASRKWDNLKYGYVEAVRLLLKKDTIRFGLFVGTLVTSFRLVESIARICRNRHDHINHAIAGGVAGLSLLIDSKSRRSVISLYIFIRAMDVVGRHLTCSGYIPSWKYTAEALYGLGSGPIMYAFLFEPYLLPSSYYRWIVSIGNVTHSGLNATFRSRWLNHGQGPMVPCQPLYHKYVIHLIYLLRYLTLDRESCLQHNTVDFGRGLLRALQVYVPVHCLPALIFRRDQLIRAPVETMQRISKAVVQSCFFLSSIQTLMKGTQCVLRNARGKDVAIHGWIGGWMSGFGIFFEQPKRRAELMLYCMPRALEIVWKLLERKRWVRSFKHGEVALFCLSMSLIMSSPPQYFKSTYLKILRFLFGKSIFEF